MSTLVAPLRRTWQSRSGRWFLLALLVAFLLRLVWAVWAAQAPAEPISDPGRFFDMADRFSRLDTEQINGNRTAFTPPGYALGLSPFAYLDRKLDVLSLAFAAALVNVVFGTVTVWASAVLAEQWFGRAARNPTAWLVALSPGLVYFTSAVLSEPVFTALVMVLLVAATWLVGRDQRPSVLSLLVFGAAVGLTILVRMPAVLLVVAPALALRARSGSWQGALRTVGWTLLATSVVLVPWTIRNAVHVGVVTPASTNGAAYLCTGHNERATGTPLADGPPECFTGSAFDADPDEAEWYRETTRETFSYIVGHPKDTVEHAFWNVWYSMVDDEDGLDAAQDYGRQPLVSERNAELLNGLANLWWWGALALAATALVVSRAARRATPLWFTCLGMVAIIATGVGLPRYHVPFMGIVAAFAAVTLVAAARGARSIDDEAATAAPGDDREDDEGDDRGDAEPSGDADADADDADLATEQPARPAP